MPEQETSVHDLTSKLNDYSKSNVLTVLSDGSNSVKVDCKAQPAAQWGYLIDQEIPEEPADLVPISIFNEFTRAQNGTKIGAETLQDMLVTQVIRQLESDPEPQLILAQMTELQQKRVLRRLMRERVQMATIVDQAKKRERWCPQADHQLWSRRWDRILRPDDVSEPPSNIPSEPSQAQEANEIETSEAQDADYLETSGDKTCNSDSGLKILGNGRELRSHFYHSWQLIRGESPTGRQRDRPLHWTSSRDHFVRDPRTSELKRCPLRDWNYRQCSCPSEDYHMNHQVSLHHLISAQLLLYRLVSVFCLADESQGIGPYVEQYKTCWRVRLQHVEYGSELEMHDYKGSVEVFFTGNEKASDEALKLLSWLVSNNVPLAYDGTLAGTRA
jgi:hypothetical protein